MKKGKSIFRRIFNLKFWGYGLFWSWNLIFLAFMFLGFAPNVVPDMIDSVREDMIPIKYLVTAVLVTLIPVMAVFIGLMKLRRAPRKLLTLGYGVEGPLMVLLLVRIFFGLGPRSLRCRHVGTVCLIHLHLLLAYLRLVLRLLFADQE